MIVRPGLIGGSGDLTRRSSYYPWRFVHPTGMDVLVPDQGIPVAMIDVLDVAAWVVHAISAQLMRVFNVTGEQLTAGKFFQQRGRWRHRPL